MCIVLCYQIAENIIEISRTTGILVDPVYNIKAIRGMLTEMKNNPGRFKGKRVLYIHTGTRFHHYLLSLTEGLIKAFSLLRSVVVNSIIHTLMSIATRNTNYVLVVILSIGIPPEVWRYT